MNRAPQGQPREERRRASQFFDGAERRRTYAEGEMPPDPTPGEPGAEARIEKDRLDRGDKKGSEES